MSDKKINISSSYEEALKRKNEVLDMINTYNEAVFSDAPLPYNDEEIALLQEEFLILDEYVELTDKEKEIYQNIDSKNYVDEVKEDGSVIKVAKVTFWDKVNPVVFVYAVIAFVGSLWFSVQGIAIEVITKFTDIVNKREWDLSDVSEKGFNAIIAALIIVYPLLLTLVSFLLYRFACRKKETKKVFFWVFMGQIFVMVCSLIATYITVFK